jgi:hypothetical protein
MLGQNKAERKLAVVQLLQHKERVNEYPIVGTTVCKVAFMKLYGVKQGQLTKLNAGIRKREKADVIGTGAVAQHGNSGCVKPSAALLACITWVLTLAAGAGDVCPVTGKVHCFMFFDVETLYKLYEAHCVLEEIGKDYQVHRTTFSNLLVGKHPLSGELKMIRWKRAVLQKMCGKCLALIVEREELAKKNLPRSDPLWQAWDATRAHHWKITAAEREAYALLKRMCCVGAHVDVLVLAMDASKPLIHMRRKQDTAEARKLWQTKGAFIGIIDHTNGCGLVFLLAGPGPLCGGKLNDAGVLEGAHPTWEGTDVNLSLLLSYLRVRCEQGQMPRHLHLQLDGGADLCGYGLIQLMPF